MSQSSDFEANAKNAKVYEVMGASGKSYVFFFFLDKSVCAAKKIATDNHAVAQLDFNIQTKTALRDCGSETHGSTYQKGQAFLKQLENRKKG